MPDSRVRTVHPCLPFIQPPGAKSPLQGWGLYTVWGCVAVFFLMRAILSFPK